MILTDTGPLVALIDTRDKNHLRCVQATNALPEQLMTTWPCMTEAMHLLFRAEGYRAQARLWAFYNAGYLVLYDAEESDTQTARVRDLMNIYQDTPMDLADASIVTAAEALGVKRVFTLDSHFYAYRTEGGEAFEVVP